MRHLYALFVLLLIIACGDIDGGPPPVTTGLTSADDDGGSTTGADTTLNYCPCVLECMYDEQDGARITGVVQSTAIGQCFDTCSVEGPQSLAHDCCEAAPAQACEFAGNDFTGICEGTWYVSACEPNAGTAMDDDGTGGDSMCCWVDYQYVCDCTLCPDAPGCVVDPDTSGTDPTDPTATTTTATTDPTGDETGGEVCDTGLYRCHGWMAGIYVRVGDATNTQFDHSNPHAEIAALNPEGHGAAQCVAFDICIPYVGDNDDNLDAALLDTCREECEMMAPVWPDWLDATELYYPWSGETACVFAIDGNNGTVPDDTYDTAAPAAGVAVDNGMTSTPKIDCTYTFEGDEYHYVESILAPHVPQVVYDGPCENSMCESQSCEDWDPATWISTSYNVTRKTYTVSVPEWLFQGILDGGFASLYACDDARWYDYTSGVGESWAMRGIAAGDFLYELGFRNGDKMARVKKTGSNPYYNLYGYYTGSPAVWINGTDARINAFVAMYGEPRVTVEFARLVNGVWTTFWIDLTRT